ncbi:MAG: nucleotidyltransferase family protein [Nannocystaceae bacterium]
MKQGAPAPQIAAVILAAGASSRMGRPKARLLWNNETFLAHLCGRARECSCAPVVVVYGAHDIADIVPPDIEAVHNRIWQKGQLSSLQRGIVAISPYSAEVTHLLVLTVDRPRVCMKTIAALIRAGRGETQAVWQPAYRGQRGHPVLYPRHLVPRLLALPPTGSARDLTARAEVSPLRRSLDVDDPAVLENFDSPEDLDDLLR